MTAALSLDPLVALPGVQRLSDLTTTAPALPLPDPLRGILPSGLRRGSTVELTGSTSLLLAVLGSVSAAGSWCAVVGGPTLSAEAAAEYDAALDRLVLVPRPGPDGVTVVGALLDNLDLVVVDARALGRAGPTAARRLAARARKQASVLMVTGSWPGSDIQLRTSEPRWHGAIEAAPGTGVGRLRAREVTVQAAGRAVGAPSGRPRTTRIWLPAPGGGIAAVTPRASVRRLA